MDESTSAASAGPLIDNAMHSGTKPSSCLMFIVVPLD
jgi:hypothetical protein